MLRQVVLSFLTAGALCCCLGDALVVVPNHNNGVVSRRAALAPAIASLVTAMAAPAIATAAADTTATTATTTPMASMNDLLDRLKGIPTFCIVSPAGASYMAFKQDQKMGVGYAFTTFQGALAVLGDAQRTAEEKGYADTWEGATITTIPLDIAVRLALKKRNRTSQKEQALDTLLMVIPGADDRQDGIAIDDRFKDQGRVPLFYVDNATSDDAVVSVFFTRKDLAADWKRQHDGVPLPAVKAIDLVGIFENILRGRQSAVPSANLVFYPNEEAVDVAKELKSKGLTPYNPGRMIL